MKQRKRITIGPVLIVSSIGLLQIAYTPIPKAPPSREFITDTYARPTGVERWNASEARKKELLSDISKIRKRIKIQASVYVLDRNTKVVAYTAKDKTNIHCTKLVMQISTQIGKRNEMYMGSQRKVTVDFNTI